MATRKALLHPAAKGVVFVVALLPFAWLLARAVTDHLGANPAEALIRGMGDWTLRFLCLTLAVTPARHLTGRNELVRFRRMLGLFTFFYAVAHLLSYSWFDMGFEPGDIGRDIVKRPFILVGFAAFVLMLPLAATSFNRAIRAIGAARWQTLHRLVYAVAVLALLHFWWMRAGKQNFLEPSIYIAIIAVLFAMRIRHAMRPSEATLRSRRGLRQPE
jgi:sulfoxide reductase heme-binding subunit YedZ